MKSKKIITYILLAASVIIWGTIVWRLVEAFRKDEVVVQQDVPRPVVNKTDSVVLVLNYDDPFLKDSKGKIPDTMEEAYNPDMDFIPHEPELVQGPTFKFKGILKAGQKIFGLLDLGGETIMVSPREKIGNFLVVSIDADKIVVRRQGLDTELFAE